MMSRPSISAPAGRRPVWARNPTRYIAVINSASNRAGKPGEDFGVDNFAYDPEKVGKWQVPEHIAVEALPEELYEASKEWVLAGAAIDTVFERIQELNEEATQRAFPQYSHEHLLAGKKETEQTSTAPTIDTSDLPSLTQSITTTSTSTAATSFSGASPPRLDTTITTANAKKYSHQSQLPDSITSKPGMESPPFTPISRPGSNSCSGARSPAQHHSANTATTPDFIKLAAQLSPLMSPSQASFTSSAPGVMIKPDTFAWESYTAAYGADLHDLKANALPRLKGAGELVYKTLFELRANPPQDLSWACAEAVVAFAAWWKDDAGAMMAGVEEVVTAQVVAAQVVPGLEDVVGGAA